MTVVKFYDDIEDVLLKFAVIITKYQGRWVFCKHKERETLEVPGRHREPGERIEETFGKLFYAQVEEFEEELHSEIEKIVITEELPEDWTYPEIQSKLLEFWRKKQA